MPLNEKIEIKKAGIHGFSWFAKEDIKAGDWLWRKPTGPRETTEIKLTLEQAKQLTPEKRDKFMALAYQIDDNTYLGFDPDKDYPAEVIENYVNHSCDGNGWYEGDDLLVAMRDIKAGEEVCYDYALTEGADDWVLADRCLCGAKNCRVKVTGRDWMRPDLQHKYGDHFLPYILEKIKKFKAEQSQLQLQMNAQMLQYQAQAQAQAQAQLQAQALLQAQMQAHSNGGFQHQQQQLQQPRYETKQQAIQDDDDDVDDDEPKAKKSKSKSKSKSKKPSKGKKRKHASDEEDPDEDPPEEPTRRSTRVRKENKAVSAALKAMSRGATGSDDDESEDEKPKRKKAKKSKYGSDDDDYHGSDGASD